MMMRVKMIFAAGSVVATPTASVVDLFDTMMVFFTYQTFLFSLSDSNTEQRLKVRPFIGRRLFVLLAQRFIARSRRKVKRLFERVYLKSFKRIDFFLGDDTTVRNVSLSISFFSALCCCFARAYVLFGNKTLSRRFFCAPRVCSRVCASCVQRAARDKMCEIYKESFFFFPRRRATARRRVACLFFRDCVQSRKGRDRDDFLIIFFFLFF